MGVVCVRGLDFPVLLSSRLLDSAVEVFLVIVNLRLLHFFASLKENPPMGQDWNGLNKEMAKYLAKRMGKGISSTKT